MTKIVSESIFAFFSFAAFRRAALLLHTAPQPIESTPKSLSAAKTDEKKEPEKKVDSVSGTEEEIDSEEFEEYEEMSDSPGSAGPTAGSITLAPLPCEFRKWGP